TSLASATSPGEPCSKFGQIIKVKSGSKTLELICDQVGPKILWQVRSGKGSGSAGTGGNNKASKPGVSTFSIESLPIKLSANPWDWPTDTNNFYARTYPVVNIFGRSYQGKPEATLMFNYVKIGTPVLAPITGIVLEVRNQPESCDVELYMRASSGEIISLDHISTTLKADKNRVIKAGEAIGSVTKWECKEPFGRFELMYGAEKDKVYTALCPMNFLAPTIKSASIAAIRDLMVRWNKHVGPGGASAYSNTDLERGVCETETARG
ncbi:MAG: hypothetical protein EBY86_06440, partial [Acidimicrobiia bacterium]|nr:hypothetical protein [Acidimicrobiia bacterium]